MNCSYILELFAWFFSFFHPLLIWVSSMPGWGLCLSGRHGYFAPARFGGIIV